MIDILMKLTSKFGVSGNEEDIRNCIREEIKDYVDDIIIDPLGNLIAIKKGKGKKIMLAAHMDEIGIIVTHIDDKGFLRFSNLGGIDVYSIIGNRVRFQNGIIGIIHFEEKLEDIRDLDLHYMYIDIGVDSREEALKHVNVGSAAAFYSDTIVQGDSIMSKSLDNRSGCAVLVDIIKRRKNTKNEIYYTFTVQEELGLRGAKTAAYNVMPDMAISVDVTGTGDTPESYIFDVKLGHGPAIKIKDWAVICHPVVKKLLIDSAKKENIPYQLEILEYGSTDIGTIHVTAGGIPSGGISIPCRYIHSYAEQIRISDMKNAANLLYSFI